MLDWKVLCIKCCFMCIAFIATTGIICIIFEKIRTKWEERKEHEDSREKEK